MSVHCGVSAFMYQYRYQYTCGILMGGTENFLSRLLKDKTPHYHGILLYSDFYTFTNILLRNLQNLKNIYLHK